MATNNLTIDSDDDNSQPSALFQERTGPAILQLNVEGLTRSKRDIIKQLAKEHSAVVLLLQETHSSTDEDLKISGYTMVSAIHHQRIAAVIDGVRIVNVYKPPLAMFTGLPAFAHPTIYADDFNCQHNDWGYSYTTRNGDALSDWASESDLSRLYNNKNPPSFHSGRWKSGTNPDLAFTTTNRDSAVPSPIRTVIGKFPRSQHRPSIIIHPALITPTPSYPVPRWNFRKANWDAFTRDSESLADSLDKPCKGNINKCYDESNIFHQRSRKEAYSQGFPKNVRPGMERGM